MGGGVDHPVFQHGIEDICSPGLVVFRMQGGGIGGGGVQDGRKACRLGKGQILDILAEIGFTGCLQPIGSVSEINIVQIHLQDLVLGVLPLQLQREIDFFQLAGDGFLGTQMAQFDQLLGDGAESF
ncbi:hypothetical protein SDC9_206102 [bioreactor metagenome]|uniref:Uncharacterized protein n=1 Tax=bioreactor metagenome TaxID=1076179 RepID=A0A645J4S8_9ZZZZ